MRSAPRTCACCCRRTSGPADESDGAAGEGADIIPEAAQQEEAEQEEAEQEMTAEGAPPPDAEEKEAGE